MELHWIVILVLTGAGLLLWFVNNRLVVLDMRCEKAMADIDVQLKHRHSILPNLLETVKGFAAQERAVLDKVADARAAALSARTGEAQLRAEAALSAGVAQLITVAESYPELQSSSHFHALRQEIADTEHKISAARRYLNAAVTEYNATLRQFPASLLAGPLRLKRRSFYEIGVERVLLDDAPTLKF